MSQFELDLGYQYKSLRNRSRSLSAVESQAKTRGAQYPELGADFFNALFQKNPKLRDDIDFNNKYNQVLRAFSQSERFQSIRAQTKGNLNWSAIGASMLLDEISKIVDFEDEPNPDPDNKDKDKPQPDNESEDNESEDGDSEEEDNDNESEDSDNESDESDNSDSDNESDSDAEDTDDNSENESDKPGSDKSDNDEDSQGSEPNDDNDADSDDNSDEDNDSDSDNDGEDSDEDSDNEGEGEGNEESEDNEGEGQGESEGGIDDNFGEDDNDGGLEDGPPKPVDEQIQEAIDKAADKMDEMIKGIKAGHGSSIPGGDAKMVDDYARLAQNPNLVKLLRMVGRLKLNNNFLSALSTANPEESMGVTIGNNIQRTLPRDLVKLVGDDDDFMIFMNKYNNRELLQRKYKSQSKPGKGPMIVCLDMSSSMASGGRYEWAQTIAAAMYMLAHKDNRLFAVVPFNDTASLQEPLSQVSKNLDIGMLSSILGMMPRGGTNFNRAWRTSIEFMRKHTGNWKNADIVFITDGEDNIDKEQWAKDKDRYNVRLFSFVIGMSEVDAHAVWSQEYIERLAHGSPSMINSYTRYYRHLFGTAAHPTITELEDMSDAMVYVEKLDAESESQAFNLVKHAQQKKGKVVGVKR